MIVFDTGPLVAMADADDEHHEVCMQVLASVNRPLVLPSPDPGRECYVLEREGGSSVEASFLRAVGDGAFTLVELTTDDVNRMAELVERYASLPLGPVDASVVAIAKRLGIMEVMTLDRRPQRGASVACTRLPNLACVDP